METASMWGRSERVIVTGGLSEAYGLPGLRIGWIVAPPAMTASLWSYHDYTTIAPGALSDRLARVAMQPARRARLLARTQDILSANLPALEAWLRARDPMFQWIRPEAGEVYVRTETPKGELGYYLISDGTASPSRVKVKAPCFVNLSAIAAMSRGAMVSDIVAILGSIDIVLGEVDR